MRIAEAPHWHNTYRRLGSFHASGRLEEVWHGHGHGARYGSTVGHDQHVVFLSRAPCLKFHRNQVQSAVAEVRLEDVSLCQLASDCRLRDGLRPNSPHTGPALRPE